MSGITTYFFRGLALKASIGFLTEETAARYAEMNERCARWARETNRELAGAALPLRVVQLGTVWTVLFTEPGRYNWLLQYYLRAEGVTMSWVGTGRCLSNMEFTDKDYDALQGKLVEAAQKMKAEHPIDVVFVTAYGDPKTRARAAAAQPVGFVTKPFSSDQLLNAMGVAGARHRPA